MWYENVFVDQARAALGVPLSPLWIASGATAVEVGGGRRFLSGHVYVFGSMCAFLALEEDNEATTPAAADAPSDIDVGQLIQRRETVVFRVCYDTITSVFAEGDRGLRMIALGSVYKFVQMEERGVVLNTVQWLMSHSVNAANDMDEVQRSIIMYPEATLKVRALTSRPEHATEYVLQDIDGAIVTNHRLLFSTTVIRLPSIELMHLGKTDLKIIIGNDLVLCLRCSQQRQALVSSVWLASLPVWTDFLDRVLQDPQKALKAHVKILARLHRQFCAMDVSRDGLLSYDEVRDAVGSLFHNHAFVDGFFRALDSDASGEVTLVEFLQGISRLVTSDMLGRIRFTFQMFDSDRSGTLDKDELYSALQILVSTGDVYAEDVELRRVCEDLFSIMDADGSGTISIDEYTETLLVNPEIHSLFRKVGLFDSSNYFLLRLAEDPLGIWHPSWTIMSALMQAMLGALSAKRDGGGVAETQPNGSTGAVVAPLVPASYVTVRRMQLNVPADVIAAYGEPHDTPSSQSETYAVLEVSAPDVFERIRTLHDVGLKNLKLSLGIDNIVGNMLLGSTTLLRTASNFQHGHSFKFVSHDGLYLLRHITTQEKVRLMLMLPQYTTYLLSNPNTLLPRYLGLYSMYRGGKQLHFVLQLNAFRQTDAHRIAICFRGAASTASATAKIPLPPRNVDATDLRAPLQLYAGWRQPVLGQLANDVKHLCSVGLCDFVLTAAVTELPMPVNATATGRGRTFTTGLDSIDVMQLRRKEGGVVSKVTPSSWGCCKPKADQASHRAVHHSGHTHDEEPGMYRSATSVTQESLVAVPSCRRALGRFEQQGGMFFSFENGVRTASQHPVSFMFINTLSHSPDRSYRYGEALLTQLEALIQGSEAPSADTRVSSSPLLMTDSTSRLYRVATDTGQDAMIGVDHSQRMIYVVGSQGERLLCVNSVLGRDSISFAKDLQCYRERSRRRLEIRVGLLKQPHNGHREFTRRMEVYFDNIVAKETFLSEAREALSGDGRVGAHTKKLRFFTTTWNVGERPPGEMHALLHSATKEPKADVVIVALQDCTFPITGGQVSLTCETYMLHLQGPHLLEYDLVCASSVWSTRTFVWVHKSLSHHVSNICTATTGSFLGNANAAGVGFKIFDSSFCVVNARFAERGDEGSSTDNFYDIMEGIGPDLEAEGVGPLAAYHHVIFCGDLKYRHKAHLHEIIEASRLRRSFESIVKNDQLVVEMGQQESFLGFSEGPITFRPTTRFLVETNGASSAHGRVYDEWRRGIDPPTWAHRILYRSLGHPIDEGKCVEYDANFEVHSSTSAPVYAFHELCARIQFVVPAVVATGHPIVVALRITDICCTGLMEAELCKVCDPWVRLLCPLFAPLPSSTRTSILRGTQSPKWAGPFVFPLVPCDQALVISDYLHFVVFDEVSGGQKNTLGVATVSLDCLAHLSSKDLSLPLLLHGRSRGRLTATIELVMSTAP